MAEIIKAFGSIGDKYQESSTLTKVGIAAGATLINPVFWVILLVATILLSIMIWWISPGFLEAKEGNVEQPMSYWRALLISFLICFVILFVSFLGIMSLAQTATATVVSSFK